MKPTDGPVTRLWLRPVARWLTVVSASVVALGVSSRSSPTILAAEPADGNPRESGSATTPAALRAKVGPTEGLLPVRRLPPVEYVLEALERHTIVLLGEGHWIRHDAELVASLVPRLAEARIVLAMETLQAPDQDAIDRLKPVPAGDVAVIQIVGKRDGIQRLTTLHGVHAVGGR